jgi:GT2 family glycosyltransferase
VTANETHMDKVDVSVIIVSWNTREMTCDCIRSVCDQTKGLNYEVVVVDNASSDGSAQAVRDQFPDSMLIENTVNKGFAAANNQGIRIAKGRYVLLLNSDTIVLDDAIGKTAEYADSADDVAIVGCRILNPDRTLQPSCFMFPSMLNMALSATYLYKVFPRNRFFAREHMGWWDRNDIREVEVVTGCFMLIRREVIETTGLLDESYFMYGEETDLCFRVRKAGYRNVFIPHAQIVHYGGASSRKMKSAMILQTRASILQFLRQHKGLLTYWFGCLAFSLHSILRIPYWLAKSIISRADRKASVETLRAYAACAVKSPFGLRALRHTPDMAGGEK